MLMHFANNTMALALSHVSSLQHSEYFSDILSPWAYAGIYALSLTVLIFGFILMKGIPVKKGDLGGCKEIPSLF